MISTLVGTMLLAAVLTVIVLQARMSTSIGNYTDMNSSSRQALSLFEREMRTAQTISVMRTDRVEGVFVTHVTQASLDSSTPVYEKHTIAYAYDAKARTLTRTMDGKNPTVVLSDIEDFSLRYFSKNDAVLGATNYADVKKILISATLRRTVIGTANSDYLVSAMVTMRNRIVTS